MADNSNGEREIYRESDYADPDVAVYRITGAFFFGAAASIGTVLERISDTHRVLIVDFSAVPFIDSTASQTIMSLAGKARQSHIQVVLTGTSGEMRRDLFANGIKPPLVRYSRSIEVAFAKYRG